MSYLLFLKLFHIVERIVYANDTVDKADAPSIRITTFIA